MHSGDMETSVDSGSGTASRRRKPVSESQLYLFSLLTLGGAGALTRLFVAPLDRLKIIVQVQPSAWRDAGVLGSPWTALKYTYKRQRLLSFWWGFGPHMYNVFQTTALRLWAYSSFRPHAFPGGEYAYSGTELYVRTCCCLFAASSSAMALSYPLDVVYTRLASDGGRAGAGHKRFYRGFFDCAIQSVRREGFWSLYRGFPLSLATAIPFIAVSVACLETLDAAFLQSRRRFIKEEFPSYLPSMQRQGQGEKEEKERKWGQQTVVQETEAKRTSSREGEERSSQSWIPPVSQRTDLESLGTAARRLMGEEKGDLAVKSMEEKRHRTYMERVRTRRQNIQESAAASPDAGWETGEEADDTRATEGREGQEEGHVNTMQARREGGTGQSASCYGKSSSHSPAPSIPCTPSSSSTSSSESSTQSQALLGEGKATGEVTPFRLFPSNLLIGVGSGWIAQTLTYPLDTIRRRWQFDGCDPGKGLKREYNSLAACFRGVTKNGGWLRLYAGVGINLLKTLPECFILCALYYTIKTEIAP
mmetsp:Transcript_52957/g.103580  ORF Transcript_52957/g.103580 Transcript_52957/m.103580 type:complete len:533 (-) Transcript_52957:154-1752(-)